jgi:hypothetical protein
MEVTPPLTEVIQQTYRNIYIYAKYKLWLAYGIAIAYTTAAVSFGLYTIFSTGASHSSDFSTILRAARGAALNNEVDASDADGRDPLPGYLKKTAIAISTRQEGRTGDGEESKQLQTVVKSGQTITYTSSDPFAAVTERRTSMGRGARSSQWESELQDLSPDANLNGSRFSER